MSELSIELKSGTKKIEVNDSGECIFLPLGDQTFVSGILELMKEFSEAADKVAASVRDMDGGSAEKMEKVSDAATLNLSVCTEMKRRVDETFGDEVCRKVFGDIVPSLPAFADFFDQMVPIIRKFSDEEVEERKKRVAKYIDKYRK